MLEAVQQFFQQTPRQERGIIFLMKPVSLGQLSRVLHELLSA